MREGERKLAGSLFHDGRSRIVAVEGVRVETEFSERMIFVSNAETGIHTDVSRGRWARRA